MEGKCASLLGWVMMCAICVRLACAVPFGPKYTVNKWVYSNLTAASTTAPSPPTCKLPGICYPVNQNITGGQVYVWCGFSSTYRTYMNITSKSNLTTTMMRQDVFNSCAKKNISALQQCNIVPNTVCDTKTKCTMRVLGLAYYDPVCFLIANNGKNTSTAAVWIAQSEDVPRSSGVPVLITAVVLFSIFVIVLFSVNIAREIKRPIVEKSRPISSSNEAAKFEGAPQPPPPPATLKSKFSGFFQSFRKEQQPGSNGVEPALPH